MIYLYFLVDNVINGVDLYNSFIQTGIMTAELAESENANRIAKTANDLTRQQMNQDMLIALKQMKQERELDQANEKLLRELSSNMIDALDQISDSIYDVAASVRNDERINLILFNSQKIIWAKNFDFFSPFNSKHLGLTLIEIRKRSIQV